MSNREDRLPSLHEILHKNRNDYVKSIYENIRSNRSEKLFELIELEIHLEKSCYYNQKKIRCFEYFFFFFFTLTYNRYKTDRSKLDSFPRRLGHRDDFNRERGEENGGETRLFPRSSRHDRYDVYYYNYALAHYIAKRTKIRRTGISTAFPSIPRALNHLRGCVHYTQLVHALCRLSSILR